MVWFFKSLVGTVFTFSEELGNGYNLGVMMVKLTT